MRQDLERLGTRSTPPARSRPGSAAGVDNLAPRVRHKFACDGDVSVRAEWYGNKPRKLEIVSDTAVWYHSGLPPAPIRWVLVRDPAGEREPQAFLSTDLAATPEQVLQWFVMRWRMETTFQEARAHLGVETQRQWSDLAILRTTPALLGLFSLVAVWANQLARIPISAVRPQTAAWYAKCEPTFSDAIATVRRALWCPTGLSMSCQGTEMIKVPVALLQRLTDTLCHAA